MALLDIPPDRRADESGEVGMNIAKPICKVFNIPCEFATSLGYCQFTACVKVRPEGVRRG